MVNFKLVQITAVTTNTRPIAFKTVTGHLATRESRHQPTRHHETTSPPANSPPSEVFSPPTTNEDVERVTRVGYQLRFPPYVDLLSSRAQRALSCTLLRSANRDRQSSSERVARASERELDLFPLLEIKSSDVILARTFQGAKSP